MPDARAREIAEDVLFPAALDVDRADRVPASHLDLLAAEGFYGVAARDDIDFADLGRLVETFASGCLTTAFVWLQHHGPVRALVAAGPTPLATTWLPALAAGRRRAGIGLAGIRNPTDPLRVRATDDGYLLTGVVPWVTGWDMIDVVYVAARDDADVVHFLLVDAAAGPTLAVAPQELVAVRASRTVNLTFTGHPVGADRLVDTSPYREWLAGDSGGSALNGFLALGVADRCARLLAGSRRVPWAGAESARLVAEADACRAMVLGGTAEARAVASELAWRGAAMVTIAAGARAVLCDQHAQRLVREAAFLLVFGSRPVIRDALRVRLGGAG